MFQKLLCKIGIHNYEYIFVPYTDQPFAYNPKSTTNGYYLLECQCCGKEKTLVSECDKIKF